jgi:tetratricopeptide (TPR) repeat protein
VTHDPRFLYQLYLLLAPVKYNIHSTVIPDITYALDALKLASQQKGAYATEAAFTLAYLFSGTLKSISLGAQEIHYFRSVADIYNNIINYHASRQDALLNIDPDERAKFLWTSVTTLANLGCSRAIDRILTYYEDYCEALAGTNTVQSLLSWQEVRLQQEIILKNSYLSYFDRSIENMCKYGWLELTGGRQSMVFSYLITMQGKYTYGLSHTHSLSDIYGPIKDRFITAANAGDLYANFYLGFIAQYEMHPYVEQNYEESTYWYERVMRLNIPACKTVFWVGNMLIAYRHGPLAEKRDLHEALLRMGFYHSGVELGYVALKNKEYDEAYRFFAEAIRYSPKKSLRTIHSRHTFPCNNQLDNEGIRCMIAVHLLGIKHGIAESASRISSYIANHLKDDDLELRWYHQVCCTLSKSEKVSVELIKALGDETIRKFSAMINVEHATSLNSKKTFE